jgi:sulfotransferase family protein
VSGAWVRIERVLACEPLPDAVAAFELERPTGGAQWSGVSFEVSGSVVGRGALPVAVEVVREGEVIGRLPMQSAPSDLTGREAIGDGAERRAFGGMVSTLGLPPDLRIELVLALASGKRVRVATLEGFRAPLRTRYEPSLRPLVLTTIDGMAPGGALALLAAHPRIVTQRQPPYECHTAKYWLQTLCRLAEPATGGADDDGARLVAREPRPGVGLYVERLADLCLRNVDSWYTDLAEHQLKDRARYFAERLAPGRLAPVVHELYGEVRELFLVRDPLAWLASQRDADGARESEGESPAAWVRRHARYVNELVAHWRARGARAHLVRHEDLLAKPGRTVEGILEYLDLDVRPAAVAALLSEAASDGAGALGRRVGRAGERPSRREPSPELHALAGDSFAAAAGAWGYGDELAVRGASPRVPAGLEER